MPAGRDQMWHRLSLVGAARQPERDVAAGQPAGRRPWPARLGAASAAQPRAAGQQGRPVQGQPPRGWPAACTTPTRICCSCCSDQSAAPATAAGTAAASPAATRRRDRLLVAAGHGPGCSPTARHRPGPGPALGAAGARARPRAARRGPCRGGSAGRPAGPRRLACPGGSPAPGARSAACRPWLPLAGPAKPAGSHWSAARTVAVRKISLGRTDRGATVRTDPPSAPSG